ncbi:hypothetical protein CSKR_201235 [Clonorchis sinensis]|uniref:Uncharacterized protein n=1 Tax=Clonorchis sinensis TaxID=79923 RepID=A0A8T1MNZ4_CLOSI|nr:hypothetical protein CSKR_201235 [Clonorchis sinensis]
MSMAAVAMTFRCNGFFLRVLFCLLVNISTSLLYYCFPVVPPIPIIIIIIIITTTTVTLVSCNRIAQTEFRSTCILSSSTTFHTSSSVLPSRLVHRFFLKILQTVVRC